MKIQDLVEYSDNQKHKIDLAEKLALDKEELSNPNDEFFNTRFRYLLYDIPYKDSDLYLFNFPSMMILGYTHYNDKIGNIPSDYILYTNKLHQIITPDEYDNLNKNQIFLRNKDFKIDVRKVSTIRHFIQPLPRYIYLLGAQQQIGGVYDIGLEALHPYEGYHLNINETLIDLYLFVYTECKSLSRILRKYTDKDVITAHLLEYMNTGRIDIMLDERYTQKNELRLLKHIWTLV